MDVNNTNSVQDEQFDNVKNNIETTVEVEKITTDTVKEDESDEATEKIEVAEVKIDEVAEQKSENEEIISAEETLTVAEADEATEKIEVAEV
ncbi:MAG: hypothetical protein LBF04_01155, partial [Prevotellaceae bacterium]|nr:hypothetical protein [Prevotellaceae bacterium]